MTWTILLETLVFVFFRGLGLRVIDISSSKILGKLILVPILMLFVVPINFNLLG